MVAGKKERDRLGKRRKTRQGTCVHWQLQGSTQLYPKSSCRHGRPPVRIFRLVFSDFRASPIWHVTHTAKYIHTFLFWCNCTTYMHLSIIKSGWNYGTTADDALPVSSQEKHIPVEEPSHYQRALEGWKISSSLHAFLLPLDTSSNNLITAGHEPRQKLKNLNFRLLHRQQVWYGGQGVISIHQVQVHYQFNRTPRCTVLHAHDTPCSLRAFDSDQSRIQPIVWLSTSVDKCFHTEKVLSMGIPKYKAKIT